MKRYLGADGPKEEKKRDVGPDGPNEETSIAGNVEEQVVEFPPSQLPSEGAPPGTQNEDKSQVRTCGLFFLRVELPLVYVNSVLPFRSSVISVTENSLRANSVPVNTVPAFPVPINSVPAISVQNNLAPFNLVSHIGST